MLPSSKTVPEFKSDIVVNDEVPQVAASEKLKGAYINERTRLEFTEVELNRSKVVMVDHEGNFIKIPFLSEH
ncbi:hypothetical protein VTH8203_03609 [Vibrio thalassae]|uniref:Uncharacterized protein n=1 Tax=Vibrio thalassae TaxID=1243014 RepID=A0A240EN87_9VIBR|nr:hypothetical protein [Vibrio thalassae]SNX49961.1 hypothetical protein VTH8203_03609 [Vibrio thalassae]